MSNIDRGADTSLMFRWDRARHSFLLSLRVLAAGLALMGVFYGLMLASSTMWGDCELLMADPGEELCGTPQLALGWISLAAFLALLVAAILGTPFLLLVVVFFISIDVVWPWIATRREGNPGDAGGDVSQP